MTVITQIAAVLGMILGSAGFVLSVINFRRDRAVLRVSLLRPEDRSGISPNFPALYVEITNTGRRKAFVVNAGLDAREPRSFKWGSLAYSKLDCSLSEGDAPKCEGFMLKDLPRFREKGAVRAFAIDSKGRRHVSRALLKRHFPGQEFISRRKSQTVV